MNILSTSHANGVCWAPGRSHSAAGWRMVATAGVVTLGVAACSPWSTSDVPAGGHLPITEVAHTRTTETRCNDGLVGAPTALLVRVLHALEAAGGYPHQAIDPQPLIPIDTRELCTG